MTSFLYAAACVIAPTLWGIAMVWLIGRVERIMASRQTPSPATDNEKAIRSPDYHI